MKAIHFALVPVLALAACTDDDGTIDDTAIDTVRNADPDVDPAAQEAGTVDPGDPAATPSFNTNRGTGASDVDGSDPDASDDMDPNSSDRDPSLDTMEGY